MFFWFLLFMTFTAFLFLHYFGHIAYIKISFVVNVLALASLVYLYFVDESTRNVRVWPRRTIAIFQFPVFLQCFIGARLIVCRWMWTYYFHIALLTLVLLVVYSILYYVVVAPLVVLFYLRAAFCPNIDNAVGPVNSAMVIYGLLEHGRKMTNKNQAMLQEFQIEHGVVSRKLGGW